MAVPQVNNIEQKAEVKTHRSDLYTFIYMRCFKIDSPMYKQPRMKWKKNVSQREWKPLTQYEQSYGTTAPTTHFIVFSALFLCASLFPQYSYTLLAYLVYIL